MSRDGRLLRGRPPAGIGPGLAGALLGAIYAGSHSEGDSPIRRYAFYGMAVAGALVLFAIAPVSFVTPLPLATISFAVFAQVVWNISRVRLIAEPAFQARLQSITSTVFALGSAIGQLWGGIVLDWLGVISLIGGAAVLEILAVGVLFKVRRPRDTKTDTNAKTP